MVKGKKTKEYALNHIRVVGNLKGISASQLSDREWSYFADGCSSAVKDVVGGSYDADKVVHCTSSATTSKARSPAGAKDDNQKREEPRPKKKPKHVPPHDGFIGRIEYRAGDHTDWISFVKRTRYASIEPSTIQCGVSARGNRGDTWIMQQGEYIREVHQYTNSNIAYLGHAIVCVNNLDKKYQTFANPSDSSKKRNNYDKVYSFTAKEGHQIVGLVFDQSVLKDVVQLEAVGGHREDSEGGATDENKQPDGDDDTKSDTGSSSSSTEMPGPTADEVFDRALSADKYETFRTSLVIGRPCQHGYTVPYDTCSIKDADYAVVTSGNIKLDMASHEQGALNDTIGQQLKSAGHDLEDIQRMHELLYDEIKDHDNLVAGTSKMLAKGAENCYMRTVKHWGIEHRECTVAVQFFKLSHRPHADIGSGNAALIYAIPPTSKNYNDRERFLAAVRATGGNIVATVREALRASAATLDAIVLYAIGCGNKMKDLPYNMRNVDTVAQALLCGFVDGMPEGGELLGFKIKIVADESTLTRAISTIGNWPRTDNKIEARIGAQTFVVPDIEGQYTSLDKPARVLQIRHAKYDRQGIRVTENDATSNAFLHIAGESRRPIYSLNIVVGDQVDKYKVEYADFDGQKKTYRIIAKHDNRIFECKLPRDFGKRGNVTVIKTNANDNHKKARGAEIHYTNFVKEAQCALVPTTKKIRVCG